MLLVINRDLRNRRKRKAKIRGFFGVKCKPKDFTKIRGHIRRKYKRENKKDKN